MYSRTVETEDVETLLSKIIQSFNERGQQFSLDLDEE